MSYYDLLERTAKEFNSIVCMGADPVIEKIPLKQGSVEERIASFYEEIIEACKTEDALPGAIKPNYAFYAQHGFEGLHALKKVCEKVKEERIPLIIDLKRGDIGKTSTAYAKEAFSFWEGDAVTISPYMGTDSVMPFVNETTGKEKGVYVLNRTSNPGAVDFQDIEAGGKKNFEWVSESILKWGASAEGNVGAVVGATSMNELEAIARKYTESKQQVPLLIPGVGAQGGSANEVVEALKRAKYSLGIVRINSSAGINYAYEKEKTDDFAGAAARAIKELNQEIGL
ncbi:orotidine-5'-phosphate decarboxylase [Candidatus Micrarchaeota archaeon]|nr:orotidine-5'-phosphate decarboxylase [Candidatus Micrarchaeota archaeon]